MVFGMYFSFSKILELCQRDCHIYIVFLMNLRTMFSTYELVKIFVTFKRTYISLSKQVNSKHGKRIVLIFLHTL